MTQQTIGPGSVVASRFRLEDRLETQSGTGLWRAVDLVLSRNVAVHVVPATDPRSAAVLTAARTSATVSDGRILRVLDALEEGDQVFVVHEWGSGSSLDRLVGDQPLEPRRAAWLVREVAEAVTVAHRHGIAHGRLVPENVMVTDAGSVKLVGFVVDAVLHGRTRADGLSDHEADVRNLGGLLYAALVARWPGPDHSVVPEAPRVHGELCRPRQVRPGIPRPLDALCDRLLHGGQVSGGRVGILPGSRHHGPLESAVDVVLALSEYLGDTVPTASPAPPLGDVEPTVLLDRRDPERTRPVPGDPEATQAAQATAQAGTQAGAQAGAQAGTPTMPASRPRAVDLQETQAAAPPPASTLVPGSGDRADHRTAERERSPGTQLLRTEQSARTPTAGSVVPPTWGPDPLPAPDAGGSAHGLQKRPGSVWWKLAAVLALASLVVLALVVALNLSPGPAPAPAEPDPTARPRAAETDAGATPGAVLTPRAVDDFDPGQQDGGTPQEHPELVGLAVDGDPTTAWETFTYEVGPRLAPYKDGVGLLLDLGREAEVGQVSVTLLGGPHDVQLLAAPPESGVPSSTEGLEVAASRRSATGRVSLNPASPVITRYLVVWLTALPVSSDGYRGRIAEVVVRS